MDSYEDWMQDSMAKCLYWGLVLVLLIMVYWYLSGMGGAEHLGEWSSALINQSNNKRAAVNLPLIDNGGQEWGDALLNQSEHKQSALEALKENFQGRRRSNQDSRENELRAILGQQPMPSVK